MSRGRRFYSLLGLTLFGAGCPRAFAIDLQPCEARPLPPGTNFAQTGIVISKLDGLYSEGQKLPGERDVETTLSYVRLCRFFSFSTCGRSPTCRLQQG